MIPLGVLAGRRPASGGALPEFVSVNTNSGTSTAASVSVPVHEEGDVLLLWVHVANQEATLPSGWSLLFQNEPLTNVPNVLLAWQRATDDEPGTVNVTLSASTPYRAAIVCYRGAADPDPDTVSQANTATFGVRSDVPVPAGAVDRNGLWIVLSGMFSNINGRYDDVPDAHTERLLIDTLNARRMLIADAPFTATPPATTIPVGENTSTATRTVRLPLVAL